VTQRNRYFSHLEPVSVSISHMLVTTTFIIIVIGKHASSCHYKMKSDILKKMWVMKQWNFIRRDCIVTSCVNCFTSIFSGFVIFTFLGSMAHRQGRPIEEVVNVGKMSKIIIKTMKEEIIKKWIKCCTKISLIHPNLT